MSDENEMVDEEVVVGGGGDSAKVMPAPEDADTTEGKTMADDAAESTKCESQFPLFLVLVASVVLVVATGAAYDWDIIVSRILNISNHPI